MGLEIVIGIIKVIDSKDKNQQHYKKRNIINPKSLFLV